MKLKVLQLHKRASVEYIHIRDKYAFSRDGSVLALADGTTQSFQGGIWAEMITRKFISNPQFDPDSLINMFKAAAAEFEEIPYTFNANPAMALLERAKINSGATSTFLAIRISGNKIEMISCGDSNLFVLGQHDPLRGIPFEDLDSLDANNQFINTKDLINAKLLSSHLQKMEFELPEQGRIILATDALSRLLLQKPGKAKDILAIQDFDTLQEFCLDNWEINAMQEDDISAIVINQGRDNSHPVIIIPPEGFSFPKPNEQEFIPYTNFNDQILTDMQINDIMRQFSFVENDFKKIKARQNLLGSMSVIIILLLGALLYFSRFSTPVTGKEQELKKQLQEKETTIKNLEQELKELKNAGVKKAPKEKEVVVPTEPQKKVKKTSTKEKDKNTDKNSGRDSA